MKILIQTITYLSFLVFSHMGQGAPSPMQINTSPLSFFNPLASGGLVYFGGSNGVDGGELWRTDGTSSGTFMLKDIFPGGQDSGAKPLVEFNGEVYFRATNGWDTHGLWKTNGTPVGTVLVKPGLNIGDSLVIGDTIFLSGFDGVNGYELWKSDGTGVGTVMLKDIVAGSGGSSPSNFCDVGGLLYFSVLERGPDVRRSQLWKSDGTILGTTVIKDIEQTGSLTSMRDFIQMGGNLYFVGNDGVKGSELWKSDGTALGTQIIKDINPGFASSSPSSLIVWKDHLYFVADNGVDGRCWWKSDGTSAGTYKFMDIHAESPTIVGDHLFFTSVDASLARTLWKSDGTLEGTMQVKDIWPGSTGSNIFGLTAFDDSSLYFTANDGEHGVELWKSDGTEAGTKMVADLVPGSSGSSPAGMIVASNKLFFSIETAPFVRDKLYVYDPNLVEPPTITSASTISAMMASAFSFQLTASGEPQSFEIRNNPPWLSLDGQTGMISGTPVVSGTVTLEARAINASGAGEWVLVTLDIEAAPPPIPAYTAMDLGGIGGTISYAFSVNASGEVVGQARDANGRFQAVLYGPEHNVNLGTVGGSVHPGGDSFIGEAACISDTGRIVGRSLDFSGNLRATEFSRTAGNAGNVDLGTHGGVDSAAYSINRNGQIVGAARSEFGSLLGTLFGTGGSGNQIIPSTGSVFSINDAGEIVGSRWLYPNFPQGDSVRIDLGTLGGSSAVARSINNRGQIVGSADLNSSGHSRAVLFSRSAGNEGNVSLGTLGGNYATAYSINNAGQVVGMSFLEGDSVQAGFLHQNGVMYNLNDLVDPSLGITNIRVGTYDGSINDFGQIAAFGVLNGQTRALLLNPQGSVSETTVGENGEVVETIRFVPGASYAGSVNIAQNETRVELLGGITGSGGVGEYGLNRTVIITPAGNDPENFVGTAIRLTGTEGDTFVLSMSYDPFSFSGLFGEGATPVLGWKDGTAWVGAVEGNVGGDKDYVNGPWEAHYPLGTNGMDSSTNTVWAVINHNSLFAVIPATVVVTPQQKYLDWLGGYFTEEQLADAEITAMDKDGDRDGLPNLLEYAFNLSPVASDSNILILEAGNKGLPRIAPVVETGNMKLKIEYVRRKNASLAGLSYTPQFSSGMEDDSWSEATGEEQVFSIDEIWDKVVITDANSGDAKRFGRIKVTFANSN